MDRQTAAHPMEVPVVAIEEAIPFINVLSDKVRAKFDNERRNYCANFDKWLHTTVSRGAIEVHGIGVKFEPYPEKQE